jgi:hypothetical protein
MLLVGDWGKRTDVARSDLAWRFHWPLHNGDMELEPCAEVSDCDCLNRQLRFTLCTIEFVRALKLFLIIAVGAAELEASRDDGRF